MLKHLDAKHTQPPALRDCANLEDWLAAQFVQRMVVDGDWDAIREYLRREYPETHHHELSGGLEIAQQVNDAATELDRILDKYDSAEETSADRTDH